MSSLVLAMPSISIWGDRRDAIPSDSMMYQHMPAMIAELHSTYKAVSLVLVWSDPFSQDSPAVLH